MVRLALLTAGMLAVASQGCLAAGVTAVALLPDYKCAVLNITDAQAQDPSLNIPILAQPSQSSSAIGYAPGIVLVHSPEIRVRDYDQVLMMDGKIGWMQINMLRPYSIPGDPNAKCVPSKLSNGRYGFGNGSP